MADIQVANTDADLSNNTLLTEENAYTITGLHTFSRSTNAPFAVASGAAVVANLDADKLDGIEATGFVKANGTVALTANWDAGAYEIRAQTLEADVSTGTAPLTIASTTKVANLNADKLDDQEGSYYLAAGNATGTLAVNRGGTGAATFTDGGVLLGSGTAAITATAVLGDGEILIGDGSGDPATLDVGSSSAITVLGTVATGTWQGTDVGVAYGGTGVSTLTDGGVLLGSGSSAITAMAVLTDGQMIVGDGSGDPVAESGATLRTSIGVGTGDSPQFTAIELGAASDTTLARASAGNVTIEGNAIYRAGGTDVAVADGGTGASSLTDGGVLLGSGTSAVTAMAVLSDGEMIVGDGSTDPVAESGSTLRTSIGCDAAGNITSGTVATARLGSGTASSATFLRGDSSWASAASDPALSVAEGRLTATTNTPVTTADVSGATSIYYTPYVGDKIALYDGSSWNIRTFTQITISLSGFTAIKPYDVFAYDNSGTVTIETLIWTNNTTRATALAYQNGVLSKSGATTRRYLGTVYINASGGQTEDTMVKRYLWNYYNRVRRPLQRLETTDSWTYTTATYRQANASTSNQVDTCVGWPEALLNLNVLGLAANTIGDNNCTVQVGIDEGGTSANDATAYSAPEIATYNAKQVEANLTKYPSVGFQYWVWTEKSTATGTTTWYGDGAGICKSGLYGEIDG